MASEALGPGLPAVDLQAAVKQVGSRWEVLRRARVLVTGGTGFVGRWLVEVLGLARQSRELDCDALILTRNARRVIDRWPWIASQPWVQLIESDVRSLRDIHGPLQVVLHGAVDTGTAEDPATIRDVCEEGTRCVLGLARTCGTRHFHLMSSGAVYTTRRVGQADPREDESIDGPEPGPYGAYSEGKRAAERVAQSAPIEGCAMTVSRVFGLAGPGLPLDGRFAIGNFIRDGLSGGPIHVQGDGRAVRSYLHAADMAAWTWSIALGAPSGTVLNVGSPDAITIEELADRVRSLLAPQAEIVVQSVGAVGSTRYVPDVSAIHGMLALSPSRSLEACIRGTAGHYHPLAGPA
jgi:nucleoside-diphosphate-sugar epimerase